MMKETHRAILFRAQPSLLPHSYSTVNLWSLAKDCDAKINFACSEIKSSYTLRRSEKGQVNVSCNITDAQQKHSFRGGKNSSSC